MKKRYDKNGDMIIETLHKTFNKQTNYIGLGNVLANTQRSMIVRPKNYRDMYIKEDNRAQNHDIDFILGRDFIRYYEKKIRELADKHNGIYVHVFHHWYNGRKIIHGIIVTTTASAKQKTICVIQTNGSRKSENILECCLKMMYAK